MRIDGAAGLSRLGRGAIIILALWAAFLNLSDVARLVVPLDTLGFAVDNDGRVTDVFDSPATGTIRMGDRIDLSRNCRSGLMSPACADVLAVVGGMAGTEYVAPWRGAVDLTVVSGDVPAENTGHRLAKTNVELNPQPAPLKPIVWSALLLDEILAFVFIAIAIAMVWQLPNPGDVGILCLCHMV